MVEDIAYELQLYYKLQLEFDRQAVRNVVDSYRMPAHALAHLWGVRELRSGAEVLSEKSAAYVRQQWLSNVRDTVVLDWQAALLHPPPPWWFGIIRGEVAERSDVETKEQ